MTARFLRIISILVLSLSLAACGANPLAQNDLGVVNSADKAAASLKVGEISGQSWLSKAAYAPSNGTFSDGLEAALEKHGTLAKDEATAHYSVNVKLSYITPDKFAPDLLMPYAPFNDMTVALDANYAVYRSNNNSKAFETTIHTTHFEKSDGRSSIVDFLVISQQDILMRAMKANNEATRDNITQFLKAYDQWIATNN